MELDLRNVANQVIDECASTNDLAKLLAERGDPHGTWVSSRKQLHGRGRLGRSWQSLEGNLFLSIVARIPRLELWSWVPLATAVASSEYLSGVFPSYSIQIKWPNDLWLNQAKVGGILCEGVGRASNPYLVIGLGINAALAPEGLDQATGALGSHADQIRSGVIASILQTLEDLENHGTGRIAETYDRLAVFPAGTEVAWGTQFGKVLGLGTSGELRVLSNQGDEVALFAEDVSPHKPVKN